MYARGLLATGTGPLILPSAERADPAVIAALAAFLDSAADGSGPARPVIALDETDGDDPPLDRRLEDRLAFILTPGPLNPEPAPLPPDWRTVAVPDPIVTALAATALTLGVVTLRASVMVVAATRAIAALRGLEAAGEPEAAAAAALVLAPRATQLPAPDGEEAPAPEPPQPPPDADNDPGRDRDTDIPEEAAAERLVEAIEANLPPGLFAGENFAMTRGAMGRAGATVVATRGRPAGVRAGKPGRGIRLALTETLTAAAPWRTARGGPADRVPVRAEDLRVRRIKGKSGTLTVFCVDASGSQAYARMAEAKGAVERVLADAYARRDQVALIAFRGTDAEVLLPPTPSLTRAKRALAALPGGGGTPIAAGLAAALRIASAATQNGLSVTLMVLTDGRANVTLAGEGGRAEAGDEAQALARRLAALPIRSVLVDTARRPGAAARTLAEALAARYVPLPAAGAAALSTLARAPT